MSIIARSIASIGYSQGPRSVSSVGYLANQQDGRSGYWRLFFTQMQEEALKKPEKPKEKPVSQPKVVELKDGSVFVEIPRKKLKEAKPKAVEEDAEELPFKPLEPFSKLPDEPNYMLKAWLITQEVRALFTSWQVSGIKFYNTLDTHTDEDDVELLLLVA